MTKQILIVDDHPIVRRGVAELVTKRCGHRVCGEAESFSQALTMVRETSPDLVLVDISLGKTSGIELLKRLKAEYPRLPTLVLSMHDELLYAERAIAAGARGYVMKDEAADHVQDAIERVLSGRIYTSPALTDRLLEKASRGVPPEAGPLQCLSDRELQVFERIGRGRGTRQIANDLLLSVKTVETYRANIKEKLGLRGAGVELTQRAVLWVESL